MTKRKTRLPRWWPELLIGTICLLAAWAVSDGRIIRIYDNDQATVTYPILVLANDNATAITQASFTLDTASPDRVYLRLSNVRYNNKGRFRLNNGTAKTWVQLNETNATCGSYEYGEMAINAHGVLRCTFAVPGDWTSGNDPIAVGVNTFDFEMTIPGAAKVFVDNGHGYRLLWFDVLESGDGYAGSSGVTQYWKDHGGDNVLGKTGSPLHVTDTIVWDDYSSTAWRSRSIGSHYNNPTSESEGLSLWSTATITDNQDNATAATCSSCHAEGGQDLSYMRVENEFIVETAMARGLTQTEGQKIAAYIRSLDDQFTLSNGTTQADAPGYPWCSPYQPGDSYVTGNPLSESDTFYWPAGSCEILDYDSESAPEWEREVKAWDVTTVADELDHEDIPVATSMPCYHCWLNIRHIEDYWPSRWTSLETALGEYYAASSLSQINTEGHQLNVLRHDQKKGPQDGATTQQWGVNRIDVVRLVNMKHWDRQFFYDGDYHGVFGNGLYNENNGVPAEARGWIHRQSRTLFDTAPHISSPTNHNQGWEFSEVGDTRGQRYANHNWYQLPRSMDPGWDPASSAQNPNDMQYQMSFMYDRSSSPYKFTVSVLDQLDMLWKVNGSGQPASGANTELTRAKGWTPNVMNIWFWLRTLYDEGGAANMTTAHQAILYNKLFEAYHAVISPYGPNYDAAEIARGTKRYEFETKPQNPSCPNLSGFSGGQNEFENARNFLCMIKAGNAVPGVRKSLLDSVATMFEGFYGSTSTDWNSYVDGEPGPPPVTLAVTSPSGGTYDAGQFVVVNVTTSGTDSMLVFLQKNQVTIDTIPDSVASSLTYLYSLDSTLVTGSDYRIGVSSASGGGITAYSSDFTVNAYVPPTPTDSVDATIGELTRFEWASGVSCEFETGDRVLASGDFGVSQPNDNGCAWLRKLHGYEKVSVTFDAVDAPWISSTASLVMSTGTDSVSQMIAVDLSPSAETDSVMVRLSGRFFDGGPRRSISRFPVKAGLHLCAQIEHNAGTITGRYSEGCTGSYTDVGSIAVSWTPTWTGIHANSRTGVAGTPIDVTAYNFKREQ